MSTSDYLENKLNDKVHKDTAFTSTTNHVSLHTGNPLETGASEVAGGSYARQAVNAAGWNASAAGVTDNVNAISFTGLPAATIVAVGIWDALAAGNFLKGHWLSTVSKIFVADDVAGNLIRSPAHGLAADARVALDAEIAGSLPGGTNNTTLYWVLASGLTADAFKVSATQAGAEIDITSVGSGLLHVVTPQVINAGGTLTIAAGNLDSRTF
jgi:hypothetical protein